MIFVHMPPLQASHLHTEAQILWHLDRLPSQPSWLQVATLKCEPTKEEMAEGHEKYSAKLGIAAENLPDN
jgi:hypothetical protein